MESERLTSFLSELDDFLYVPGSFDHLRALIVELAMTGRLSKAPDEDASGADLLADIRAHKAALKIKPYVNPDGPPASLPDLPAHWESAYLGDLLTHCRNGTSSSPNSWGEGYPVLRISAGTSRRDGWADVTDVKHTVMSADDAEGFIIRSGDLLACRFNGNLSYVGHVAQVPEGLEQDILHPDKLICLRAALMSTEYLRIAINSPVVRRQIEAVATTTAGNIGINGKQLRAVVIPIPPLTEQIEVSARVDEVLQLVDELESRHLESESIRERYVSSSLGQLSEGLITVTGDDLLDLVRTPSDVRNLEQAFLGLAARGQLVTQVQSVSSVHELLSRDGKPVEDGSWSVPHHWAWVRLEHLAESVLGKMLDKNKNKGDFQPYLGNSNVRWFGFQLADLKEMRFEEREFDRYTLLPGDVVVCEGGEAGRAAVWTDEAIEMRIQKALHRVRCGELLRPDWLAFMLRYFSKDGTLASLFTGIGIPHLTGASLKRVPIPLPPVEEQDEIIARLKLAYMELDRLNESLVQMAST